MNKIIIFSCSVLLVISCILSCCYHSPSPSQHFLKTVGKEIYTTLSNPTSVKMVGQGLLSQAEIERLQKFLLEDKGYIFDRTKKCLFVPEATFVFEAEKEQVVVFLSFFCKQIKFVRGDQTIVLDSDPMDKELKALIFKE